MLPVVEVLETFKEVVAVEWTRHHSNAEPHRHVSLQLLMIAAQVRNVKLLTTRETIPTLVRSRLYCGKNRDWLERAIVLVCGLSHHERLYHVNLVWSLLLLFY